MKNRSKNEKNAPRNDAGNTPGKEARKNPPGENVFSFPSHNFLSFGKFGRGRRHKLSPAEGKEGKLPNPEYGLEYGNVQNTAKYPEGTANLKAYANAADLLFFIEFMAAMAAMAEIGRASCRERV